MCLTGQTVHSFSSQKLKTGFTGGFSSISSSVSDSGPASVSSSGSGADSVSGSGSGADSASGSGSGADSESGSGSRADSVSVSGSGSGAVKLMEVTKSYMLFYHLFPESIFGTILKPDLNIPTTVGTHFKASIIASQLKQLNSAISIKTFYLGFCKYCSNFRA